MEKYSYMVNPRIPLKLRNMEIRRSKNLDLTKDEVKFALKHGPVYRKFDARTLERVTLQNIDNLHVAVKGDKVVAPVIQNKVVEEVKPQPVEEKVPEVETMVEDTKVVEEVVSEPVVEAEEVVTETVETAVEEITEEVVSDSVVETEEVVTETVETAVEDTVVVEEKADEKPQFTPNNNNYYRKKKRNR